MIEGLLGSCRSGRGLAAGVAVCWMAVLACQGTGVQEAQWTPPARVSRALETAPPARRASLRLVIEGLESDMIGESVRAQGSYERALQVDPTNPYAYLAIARHLIENGDPERAADFLDQAESLFRAQGQLDPGVEVQLTGLRGEVLLATGRAAAAFELLELARDSAPEVWDDGHLSAAELL